MPQVMWGFIQYEQIMYMLSIPSTLRSFCSSALLAMLLIGCLSGARDAVAQVSVTATAGTPGPTNYTTLSAAFDAVNVGTHQGSVVLTITANTTEPASPGALRSSGTGAASYADVLIRPQGDRVVSGLPSAARGIVQFNGADNVTIDGDDPNTPGERNLTIQATAPSSTAGIGVVRFASVTASSDGATNNTIRNCIIIGSRSGPTSTLNSYGIYVGSPGSGDMFNTGSSWSTTGITIQNNVIRRCFYGIFFAGNTAGPATGLVIRSNMIESPTVDDGVGYRGILLRNTPSAIVQGNRINMWTTGGNTGPAGGNTVMGIELGEGVGGTLVDANRIEDLLQGNTSNSLGCYGILVGSATGNNDIRITNNFIRDIRNWNTNGAYTFVSSSGIAVGIRVTANAQGLAILHNTISMALPNTNSGQPSFSACLQYTTSVSGSVIRNNIFSNTQPSSITASRHFCVMAGSNAALGTVDHNAYHSPGNTGFTAYNGADRATLAAWTPVQTGSIELAPPFVSSTDLHLDAAGSNYSAFVGAGAPGTGVLSDIDGDARQVPPTLGADEPGCVGTVPTAAVNGGGTYCSDQLPDVLFTFTGTAPFNFTYSNGTNSFTVTGHPSTSFTIANAGAGTYSITALSDALGCNPGTLGGSVVVNVVQASNAGTDGTLIICANGQATSLFDQLGGTPQPGGIWSGPSAAVNGIFDPATMVGGNYTYEVPGIPPCVAASATVLVVIDPCLGIDDLRATFGLRWNGQDGGGVHHFSMDGAGPVTAEIRDASGRITGIGTNRTVTGQWTINMTGKAAGVYVVTVRTDRGILWSRFVHHAY